MDESLKLKIDSSQARADLGELAKALDSAGKSSAAMERKLSTAMKGTDASIRKAMGSMERYSQVAALMSKIEMSSRANNSMKEFANTLNAVGSAKTIRSGQLSSWVKFIEIGARASALKFNPAVANQMRAFAGAMSAMGASKGATPAQINNLSNLFKVLATAKAPTGTQRLAGLFATLGTIRAPSASTVTRLEAMFRVLGSAKSIPGADRIAHDLDTIGAAAGRAARNLGALPGPLRGLGPVMRGVGSNARVMSTGIGSISKPLGGAAQELREFNRQIRDSNSLFRMFSTGIAGISLTQLFSGLYDTNVALMKLDKSLLFATGTFQGSATAMQQYINMSQQLGVSIAGNADAFGRFAISSKTSGYGMNDTMKVFEGVNRALQAAGATTAQTELAFYGLSQMMSKGKVSSEEFNRQIGEQIPGNAIAGARALAKLDGGIVSVSRLFDEMKKGTIMSAGFVKLWADELNQMYLPLQKIIDIRPDVAFTRLGNAFGMIQSAIGKAGFMRALGVQFKNLTDMIVQTKDGVTSLTPQMQELADKIGRNLGDAIRSAGEFLAMLIRNADTVVTVIKSVAVYMVATSAIRWYVGMIDGLRQAAEQAKNLLTTMKAVKTTAASTVVAPTIASGGTSAVAARASSTGAATAMVVRQQLQAQASAKALTGANGRLAASFVAMSAAARTAGTAGLATLRFSINGLVGLLVAATAAMLIFSDKVTKVGEKSVTFGDILMASFAEAGEGIGNWVNEQLSAWDKILGKTEKSTMSMGDYVTNFAAVFIWLGKTIFIVADEIGKTIGNLMSGPIVNLVDIMLALSKGDFTGALKIAFDPKRSAGADLIRGAQSLGSRLADNNVMRIRDDIRNRAGARAADRASNANQAELDEAARQQIEAALAAQDAAAAQQAAAQALMDAANKFKDEVKPLSFAPLLGRMQALANGTYGAGQTAIAASTTGGRTWGSVRAAQDAHSAPAPTTTTSVAAGQPVTMARVEAILRARFPNMYVTDRVRPQNATYGARNSYHKTGQALDLRLTPGMTKEAIRSELERNGINVRELLGPGDRGHNDHFHVAWGNRTAAATAATGGGGAQAGNPVMTEDEGETALQKRVQGWRRLQGLLGIANPAAGAAADFQEKLVALEQIIKAEEELAVATKLGSGFESMFNQTVINQMQASFEKMKRDMADAINPMMALNRIAKADNEVLAKRVMGLSDEADWQGRINDLREQGYPVDLMQDAAGWERYINELKAAGADIDVESLLTSRDQFLQNQATNRVLQSRLDLTQAINNAEADRASRYGSARDGAMAQMIASNALEGETSAQAQARMRASVDPTTGVSEWDNRVAAVNVNEANRVQDVVRSAEAQIEEMRIKSRMNGSDSSYFEDFKSMLGELIGNSNLAFSEMVSRADATQIAMARGFADTKRELENPPGFRAWVDALEPFEKKLQSIKGDFMNSLSEGITAGIMNDDFDWGSAMKDISRQIVKGRVDQMLGAGVSWLTGGKAMAPVSPEAAALTNAGGTLETAGYQLQTAAASLGALATAGGTIAAGMGTAPMGPAITGSDLPPVSQIASAITSAAPGTEVMDPVTPLTLNPLNVSAPTIASSGAAPAAQGGGFFSRMLQGAGGWEGIGMTGLGLLGSLIGGKDKAVDAAQLPGMGSVNGVIGELGGIDVSGKAVDAKTNKTGVIMNALAQLALSSAWPGGGGGGASAASGPPGGLRNMWNGFKKSNFARRFAGMFEEGGISGQAVAHANMGNYNWANAPHYSEGTPNTSGGMPAILHPDEAVIPLSRGRSVPVEMRGGGGGGSTTNITIVTPDANSFRAARASIQRQQNKDQKRAQLRNLNG